MKRSGSALGFVALMLVAGCRTYPITYDPNAPVTSPGGSLAAASPVDTSSSLPATTTAPPVPVTPAPTVAPTTTVRRAAPPATVAQPSVTSPPVLVYRFPGAVSVVANTLAPAVVDIDAASGAQHAYGTGMVLTTSGQIVTNNHVIRGARTIAVRSVNTGRVYAATVVGANPSEDVAVLQLQNPSGLVGVMVGGSVALGDAVTAVGNTGGRGGTPSIRTGAVVATGQSLTAVDAYGGVEHLTNLIEISTSPEAGDSGAPVANATGQVIGMVVAASAGAGYAIPIGTVMGVAQQFPTGH